MKDKLFPIIQAVMAVILLGAVKIWAKPCAGLLDLANGNQTHMKCWFSTQAVVCIAVIVLVTSLLLCLIDKAARKKVQIVIICASVLMILVFNRFIGMCMGGDMACHMTYMWIMGISAVLIILSLADMLIGAKNQIPD